MNFYVTARIKYRGMNPSGVFIGNKLFKPGFQRNVMLRDDAFLKIKHAVNSDIVIINDNYDFLKQMIEDSKSEGVFPVDVDKTALQSYYDTVKDTAKGNYTDASWNTFQSALTNAESILDNVNATQSMVNSALNSLQTAFNGLAENPPEPVVDKTALQNYYDSVKDTQRGTYTESSWNTFQLALTAAGTVLSNDSATQTQVDNALTTLQNAFGALEEEPVNKDSLEGYMGTVDPTENDGYTEESWTAFQNALSNAHAVDDNPNATQEEVDIALQALQKAFSELEKIPVDKTALQSLYDSVKDTANDNYTTETWSAFQSALAASNTVLGDANATQEQVDASKTSLQDAFNGLAKIPVDKTTLDATIAQANGLTEADYTAESWQNLQTVKTTSEAVSADDSATQEQVDTADTNLKAAIEALVAAESGGQAAPVMARMSAQVLSDTDSVDKENSPEPEQEKPAVKKTRRKRTTKAKSDPEA